MFFFAGKGDSGLKKFAVFRCLLFNFPGNEEMNIEKHVGICCTKSLLPNGFAVIKVGVFSSINRSRHVPSMGSSRLGILQVPTHLIISSPTETMGKHVVYQPLAQCKFSVPQLW